MAARMCVTDTILPRGGGANGDSPLFVQAGTKVDMYFGVMQRDPDFWGTDAEEFRPERWQTVRPRWEYIPFFVSIFPVRGVLSLLRFVHCLETVHGSFCCFYRSDSSLF